MQQVYLGLGSNLGDRLANLEAAIAGLPPQVLVTAVSRVYETKAWGIEDQPDFLNMALGGETALEPTDLLHYVKQLEVALGRTPGERWGPRVIDIDILFYDDLLLDLPALTIPHPGAGERATVLVPLADIAPGLVHPQLGESVAWLAARAELAGIRPYKP